MRTSYTIIVFLVSCIYADTNPPEPSSLAMSNRRVQLQATLEPNMDLILRFWHQEGSVQVPFEEGHASDSFGIYINQFDWPAQSKTFSFWISLDKNSNSEIDAPDLSTVLLNEATPRLLISEAQFKGLVACTPDPTSIPSEQGDYYCLFTPQEETLALKDRTPFAHYRPYTGWQKTTGQAVELRKPVFLPSGSDFYGKCILDMNSNAHYDFQETVFQVSGFTPNPGSCRFTITP